MRQFWSHPPPSFFGSGNWCGGLDKKHLVQSRAQYKSSFIVRGSFLVKEEGRFPSMLALPPGVHLRLWFPSFTFCSYTCNSVSHLPFCVLSYLCSPLHRKFSPTRLLPSSFCIAFLALRWSNVPPPLGPTLAHVSCSPLLILL